MERKGVTLWFTGLSGSGKTTISKGVERELKVRKCPVEVLDGDAIRTHLSITEDCASSRLRTMNDTPEQHGLRNFYRL